MEVFDHETFISSTFLFSNINRKEAIDYIKKLNCETIIYNKGETVYSPAHFMKRIGFIYDGECVVKQKKSGHEDVVLNMLKAGESFGIVAVITNKQSYPTYIVAKTTTKIVFIDGESLVNLLKSDTRISYNLITFLGQRIDFLNKKVSTFTSPSVEIKLASYLYQMATLGNDKIFVTMTELSKRLSIGRASLYRALDKFIESGIISSSAKTIEIINANELERILK